MTGEPDDPKRHDAQPPEPIADKPAEETAAVNDDVYRVLFDHEMERNGGSAKIPQPRRRRRLLKGQ